MKEFLLVVRDFLLFILGIWLLTATMVTVAAVLSSYSSGLMLVNIATILLSAAAVIAELATTILTRWGQSPDSAPESKEEKPSVYVYRLSHVALVIYAITVTLSFKVAVNGTESFTLVWIAMVWTELAVALILLALLNRRQRLDTFFLTTGAASAALVFASAWFYAPSIYGWDLRSVCWYGIMVSAIPLLMFISILLRRYSPFFVRNSHLRHGLITIGASLR